MSRLNFQNKAEGHRFDGPSNRDLQQKLTYQQLLNLNHDLSKENAQLKNICNRLGQQLRNLHNQFDIKPIDTNAELYHAIGAHPILHTYELTLIPLLDAYQAKIQQFQAGFESINDEFMSLEKKFEEIIKENEQLKLQLTDKIKQNIELYKTGSSSHLPSDFSQLILQQINEKQKVLVEENNKLERDYQRYKSEADRGRKDVAELRERDAEQKSKIKELEIGNRQLQMEVKSLKENIFNAQVRNNEIENDKKKLKQDFQRAESQLNQLNKEKDSLSNLHQKFKQQVQQKITAPTEIDHTRTIEELTAELQILKSQQSPDDTHRKYGKLQKEYEALTKQRNKLKEMYESEKIKQDELQELVNDLKKRVEAIESQKMSLELNETKLKKSFEQIVEKSKNDAARLRKAHQEELEHKEDQWSSKVDNKQKKILELEQTVDKIKLERDKLQKQNNINSTLNKDGGKAAKTKDSERIAEKLKEKLTINEQLFKEQLQILENDNAYLKREADNVKTDAKDRGEELRKLKQEYQKVKKDLSDITEQKAILIEEIRRVRNDYQGNLRDKERQFDLKIKEIKKVVEEADKKRKSEREAVNEKSRQFSRKLEQIKETYEERIRQMQNEGGMTVETKMMRKVDNY